LYVASFRAGNVQSVEGLETSRFQHFGSISDGTVHNNDFFRLFENAGYRRSPLLIRIPAVFEYNRVGRHEGYRARFAKIE